AGASCSQTAASRAPEAGEPQPLPMVDSRYCRIATRQETTAWLTRARAKAQDHYAALPAWNRKSSARSPARAGLMSRTRSAASPRIAASRPRRGAKADVRSSPSIAALHRIGRWRWQRDARAARLRRADALVPTTTTTIVLTATARGPRPRSFKPPRLARTARKRLRSAALGRERVIALAQLDADGHAR